MTRKLFMSKFTLEQKILLILFQGADLKALTYRPFARIIELLPGEKPSSVRAVYASLYRQGLTDKIEREERVLFAITILGRKRLTDALMKTQPSDDRRWEGKIHLVLLSVPEKQRQIRQQIRSLLVSYNYRILHQGIWFCPVKNEELEKQLKDKGLLGYLSFVDAINISGVLPKLPRLPKCFNSTQDENKDLVIYAYRLDSLWESYEKYLNEAARLQKMSHFDISGYIKLIELQQFFLITVWSDPFFPDYFLRLSVLRKKCREMFLRLGQKTYINDNRDKL